LIFTFGTKVKEAGMNVMVLEEKKTPTLYCSLLTSFIYIGSLKNQHWKMLRKKPDSKREKKGQWWTKFTKRKLTSLLLLFPTLPMTMGWAFFGDVGSLLQKSNLILILRNYVFKN